MKKAWLLGFSLFFIAVTATASVFVYPRGLSAVVTASAGSYPNDPLLGEQWGWFKINADAAWLTGHEGKGVVVAIFDTGIDHDHPDLKDVEIVYAWNYVENNSNVTDVDGHGTLVAGVIAATTNNRIGIAGVAPKIQLAVFKVLEERGGSWIDLARAIREARGIGADVYVMSLGGSLGVRGTLLIERELNRAYAEGAVIVAAAGNTDSDSPTYPAAYEAVIGVGAIDKNDTRASWSSYGINVELMAPGVSILSTYPNNKYAYASGTSMSAPHVAGVVALLLGKEPNLTPDEVRERLRTTAVKLGDPYYYGYGLVDAQGALGVEVAEPPEPPPPIDVEEPPLIEDDEEPIVTPPEVQPPVIMDIITSPENPKAGSQVKFEGVVEAPDGWIVSWLWDFGDGSTSTEQSPYHTYENAGEYNVRLTVIDSNDLSAYETVEIIVQDPEIVEPTPLIPTEIAILAIVVIIAVIAIIVLLKRATSTRTAALRNAS